jgi:hypothetical protein
MEMLKDHLIPWAREHFDDADWCFQQERKKWEDLAPEHKTNEAQEYCLKSALISFQETNGLRIRQI